MNTNAAVHEPPSEVVNHDTSRVLNRVGIYLRLAIPFLVVIAVTQLNFRMIGDEGPYHYRVIEQFASTWPTLSIANYPSASTPLPYLLWVLLGKVVGFELWKLRLLSVVVTYAAVCLFEQISRQHHLPHPVLSALTVACFPYVIFHSATIYTVNFGLFFGIWALYYYLHEPLTLSDAIKGSVLATLAVYSRQYELVLPLVMLLYWCLRSFRQNRFHNLGRQTIFAFALALPLIAILPLFALWHGVTPPLHQNDHFIHPIAEHINFVLIFTGFYFLPFLFRAETLTLFRRNAKLLLVFALLIPLYVRFQPIYSEDFTILNASTGIIAHGLSLLGHAAGASLADITQFMLWAFGAVLILSEAARRPWDALRAKLLVYAGIFVTVMIFTPYVAERYYTPLVPVLILLFHRSVSSRKYLVGWLVVLIILSMVFSYWEIALKPSGS